MTDGILKKKERVMNRILPVLSLIAVLSCGAESQVVEQFDETSSSEDALSRGRAILRCQGENAGVAVTVTIFENRDTHLAVVDVTREGKSSTYSQRVFGDVGSLGVNKRHVSFLNPAAGFSLQEYFRKKTDVNVFRPAFVYRAASVDMGNAGITCTRVAKSQYLYPTGF